MTISRRVLITRAQPGAASTAMRIKEAGHSPVTLPLLQLRPLPLSEEHTTWLSEYEGDLIFTSANGVRFAPVSLPHGATTVWCVGDATAKAALKAGFVNVKSAKGSATDLLEQIRTETTPEESQFLHFGHAQPRGFIVETLASHGYKAIHIPLYDAQPTPNFASSLLETLIGNDRIDVVMIHSPASGKRFADIWRRHGLGDIETPMIAAISDAAGEPLKDLAGDRLKIASSPTETALIGLLNMG